MSPWPEKKKFHSFGGRGDGIGPGTALLDVGGVLYGATNFGGRKNFGAIFKVRLDGSEHIVYSFDGTTADGCYPSSGLTNVKGELYGTGSGGAELSARSPASSCPSFGTAYRITPTGSETTLHRFTGGNGGANPSSGLTSFRGKLYGTTQVGGRYSEGTAYSLAP